MTTQRAADREEGEHEGMEWILLSQGNVQRRVLLNPELSRRVISALDSYSEGPGYKPCSDDRLSSFRFS